MKKLALIIFLIILTPIILNVLFLGFHTVRCGGLPIRGVAFAGDRWYETSNGTTYFDPFTNPLNALLSLSDDYFCSATEAQKSGYRKGISG